MDPTRFDAAVEDWLRYQANGPGRIRGELLWRGLARHLPREAAAVLDVGGGTGELAIRLARAGHHVTVVDFSPAMLVAARTRTDGLDVRCLVGRAEELSTQALGVFQVVTCHSVLEFSDDPSAVLAACARCLAPNGLLSVAFGNSRYLPLKTAVTTGDFRRARDEAEGRGREALDCFGLPKRLFRAETITGLLGQHGFKTTAEYGIRVVTDLFHPSLEDAPERFDELMTLEAELMLDAAYCAVARYVHIVAERKSVATG